MPTNLKNLLSRSRSRTELKSRGEKEEIPPCSCSCSGNCDGSTPHSGNESQPHPTTCQCQLRSESARTKPTFNGGSPVGETPLRRDSSSRSLFSLPGEGSCPDSPAAGLHISSTSSSPNHLATDAPTTSQSPAMRKCETVLALSSFTGSSNTGSSSNSSSPEGGSSSTSTPTSASRVKVVKDRILSTSSSALSTLLQTSNKTTTKLFSGWKFSTNNKSSHHHQSRSPAKGGLDAASKSQLSVYEPHGVPPLTPMNRLRRHGSITANTHPFCLLSSNSRHSSLSSVAWVEDPHEHLISCRLCLSDVRTEETVEILTCSCRYCTDCVTAYVLFEVQEGAYDIACPDAACERQGVLTLAEIESLVPSHIVEKYKKFRLFKDVESDCELMWCPTPGCETICKMKESDVNGPKGGTLPVIQCSRCQHVYCTKCRLPVHAELSCGSYRQKLIRQGKLNILDEEPFAGCDSIKKCPFCHVPIEKDSGCAQMMCKRCKHVFCWYCLSSLDDDFLLRHYDKGPCKNKLGHSRASVVWHRTQVIGIFAGFGLLVLLASPLLILAAPCLLCCRCRYCSAHLDPEDSPVSI